MKILGGQAHEEILHFFPKCKNLKVVIIGPNLQTESSESRFSSFHLCKGCKKKKCVLEVQMHKMFYHDALATGKITKPTIAICLNCQAARR